MPVPRIYTFPSCAALGSEVPFTKSVYGDRGPVRGLHGRGSTIGGMDIVAVALALLAFLALYGLIELVDRI
jgi:hypothetical protein